jgi:rubredoxin/uncharacterized membrane protein
MRRWKCTVCGYIHEGDEPPEKCPVCRADRSKFVEIEPATEDRREAGGEKSAYSRAYDELAAQIDKHHLHSVTTHVPNGVVPVAVLLVALALLFDRDLLAQAAYYNVIVVAASIPVVWALGFVVWKKRWGGNLTRPIKIKMIGGAAILLTALLLVAWRHSDPDVAHESSSVRWLYFLVYFVMLGVAGLVGRQGGKLIYGE